MNTEDTRTTSEQDDRALIEYYRSANSDLTVSDLAILIHVRGTGAMSRQGMVSAVDAELQEVREVLNVLIAIASNSTGLTIHEENAVDRARALWAKLQIAEPNEVPEQEKSNA